MVIVRPRSCFGEPGYTALTLVVAAGVGAVVAESPAILTGLTIVGATYLRHSVCIPST